MAIPKPSDSDRLNTPGADLTEILAQLIDAVELAVPLSARTDDPAPIADVLQVYARRLGGRPILSVTTPAGRQYQLQPSFFGNFIGIISPSRTTGLQNIGMPQTATGTVSHPTSVVNDYQVYGRMANFATIAATVDSKAGVHATDALFYRGNVAGYGGWWSSMRVGTPDIDEVRMVAGLGNGSATTNYVAATSIQLASFIYDTAQAHTNWHFWTKAGGAAGTLVNTGIPLRVGGVYDMYTRCRPNDSEIEWEITDADTGQTATGTATVTIPAATTLLRPVIAVHTLEATGAVKNVRFQRIYMESDR